MSVTEKQYHLSRFVVQLGCHWRFAFMPIQWLTTSFRSMKLNPKETLKFGEIEELPQCRHLTKEEQTCEEHFQRTTKRNQDGQFVVKLLFKESASPLGDSFQQAKRRLDTLLRRLIRDESIYTRHAAFIEEFQDPGLRNPHRIRQKGWNERGVKWMWGELILNQFNNVSQLN